MNRKIFYLFVIIALLNINFLFSQNGDSAKRVPSFYIGAYGAINANIHFADFDSLIGIPNCCPHFTDGTGTGFEVGGLVEIPFNDAISLDLRLGFSTLNANLKVNEAIGNYPVKLSDGSFSTILVDVEHSINSKLFTAGFAPAINFKFFGDVFMSAGFRASYMFTASFDQVEQLLSPEDVTFRNGTLVNNVLTGQEIPNKNSFLLFGVFGIGYNFSIGGDAKLTPEIRYDVPFMNIATTVLKQPPDYPSGSWKAASLQFGLALKFPVYPTRERELIKETIFKRDTNVIAVLGLKEEKIRLTDEHEELVRGKMGLYKDVERTIIYETYEKQIPKTAKLESSIEITGIAPDGTRRANPALVIEELETEEGFPLLPHIYFEEGSSDLTQTNLNLLTKDKISDFAIEKLPWNTLNIYSELLNIVAKRLVQNPKANLTITGCNSNSGIEAKNVKLSQQRAEAVKNYFVNTWYIDAKRIVIKKQNLPDNPGNKTEKDGQIENQRAELSSNDFNIIMPVNLKEIARKANPPLIEIKSNVESDAGLKDWELTIVQDRKEIRKYSSDKMPEKIEWKVEEEPSPRLEAPINIKFNAKDVIEQETNSEKKLSIEQLTIKKKRFELKDDKRVEKFALIVFDYDKATVTPQHKMILDDIKSRIKPNSKVTIAGYTDRTGEAAYNKELAQRRADEVEKILQVPPGNLTLIPVGSDVLLYDNNKPQGRGYSRTVQITIETPVKE
jgi:outer membrane protein OmpA-like peptidoglycan-associated protein